MDEWIRDLVDSATRGLRVLVDAVWERIAWVVSFIVGILVTLKNAWGIGLNGARHGLTKLVSVADEAYKTLYWLARVRIPQAVSAAKSEVVSWATTQVNNARTYAKALVLDITRWITDRLREARAFVDTLTNWISGKLAELFDTTGRTSRLVFSLLTSPQRMATWLIDAMVSESLRYLNRNADRLFTFVRHRTIYYTLQFADRIEDQLRRLL